MMQSEFEELLGRSVDHEEYEKIEFVYMIFERMSKQGIADLYKCNGEFVTNALYDHLVETDRIITKNYAKIDELQKSLDCCNKSVDKIMRENEQLQVENNILKDIAAKYQVECSKNKNHIEELETQLCQYKAVFADMEKNMMASLYGILLGTVK